MEQSCCVTCQRVWKVHTLKDEATVHSIYRCRTCGEFLECKSYCQQHQQWTPLHKLEVHGLKGSMHYQLINHVHGRCGMETFGRTAHSRN